MILLITDQITIKKSTSYGVTLKSHTLLILFYYLNKINNIALPVASIYYELCLTYFTARHPVNNLTWLFTSACTPP